MSRPGSGVRGAAVVLLVLGLAACGSDDSEPADAQGSSQESSGSVEPSSEPTTDVPADAPECADLWVEDGELPRRYAGCVDPAGAYVPGDKLPCSSGQVLVSFDDTYYGVLGGTIHQASAPLAEDRDYRAAVRSCRA